MRNFVVKHNEREGKCILVQKGLESSDNAGLYHALKYSPEPVLPIFIFDKDILDDLDDNDDARVTFIFDTVQQLKRDLESMGCSLYLAYDKPKQAWAKLLNDFDIVQVHTNRDYEPYAKKRDDQIRKLLSARNIPFNDFKDHVIFDRDEIRKDDGEPYVIYTPYKKKWLHKLSEHQMNGTSFYLVSYHSTKYLDNLLSTRPFKEITLRDMKFNRSSLPIPANQIEQEIVKNYDKARDFPAVVGTTKLGIHFRFGTISIRDKARQAMKLNDVYLSELIWRDFYSQILDCFPKVVTRPFRDKYMHIPWRDDQESFDAWCRGVTGYPLVDAGMRELNATGYMHNRVRMLVASFLTKHLLIDWRKGEAYFASKLLDFDLASNVGGWQWAAGCGTDAAPYFRIFSPEAQRKKFDPDSIYIRKWIPELDQDSYPSPIVDHVYARNRCLQIFKSALQY